MRYGGLITLLGGVRWATWRVVCQRRRYLSFPVSRGTYYCKGQRRRTYRAIWSAVVRFRCHTSSFLSSWGLLARVASCTWCTTSTGVCPLQRVVRTCLPALGRVAWMHAHAQPPPTPPTLNTRDRVCTCHHEASIAGPKLGTHICSASYLTRHMILCFVPSYGLRGLVSRLVHRDRSDESTLLFSAADARKESKETQPVSFNGLYT